MRPGTRASEHAPDYFEWLYWLGLGVYGLAFTPAGALALVAQAIIFGSIWKITGIPATEAQAVRSNGDAYRDYQGRVSMFVPLPAKRS